MKKSFENQWKDALGDASQTPPPEIWERVEAELDKKKRRFLLWSVPAQKKTALLSGVAAAITLVLGTTLFLMNSAVPEGNITQHTTAEKKEETEVKKSTVESTTGYDVPALTTLAATVRLSTPAEVSTEPAESAPVPVVLTALPEPGISYPKLSPLPYHETEANIKLPGIRIQERPVAFQPPKDKKLRIGLIAANAPFNPNFSAPGFQQQALSAVQNSDALLAFDRGPSGSGQNGFYTNSSRTDAYSTFQQGQAMGLGITIARKLKKRLSLETGIRFTRATATNTSNVYTVNKTTGQTESFSHTHYMQSDKGASDVLISVSGTSRYSYNFLSIPLLLNYQLLSLGKLQMNAVGGLSNEFLVSGTVVNARENEQHFQAGNSNFRTVNLAGIGGVRLSYPITSLLDINLGGTYQHFLTSGLEKHSQATFRPSMLGINLGISVRQ